MPASPASRRASGVTVTPPDSRAGPKLRSGVRTSKNGSSLIGCCGALGGGARAVAERAAMRERAGGLALAARAGLAGALAAASGRVADDADDGADRRHFAFRHADFAASTPASVAGTSIDTLSVSISNRLSPGFTASPADLNHLVILPSATVSPSCGMRMFIPIPDGRIHHVTETYCVSKNSISPSCAPSRPRPDCFMPPNGAAGSETMPRFNPIMPKSSFSETRRPRLKSLV